MVYYRYMDGGTRARLYVRTASMFYNNGIKYKTEAVCKTPDTRFLIASSVHPVKKDVEYLVFNTQLEIVKFSMNFSDCFNFIHTGI